MTQTHGLVERNAAAARLVQQAYEEVTAKYGSQEQRGQTGWLPYHNLDHAEEVHDAAFEIGRELAKQGRIDPRDVPLLRIAGAFHDHEQDLGSGPNEQVSAERAIAAMREHPEVFDESDITKVRQMIEGTTVYFDDEKNMKQMASADDPLAATVADADLSSIGKQTTLHTGSLLLAEFEAKAGRVQLPADPTAIRDLPISAETTRTFLEGQARLLERHRYLTDVGEAKYGATQLENAQRTQELLANPERISSYGAFFDAGVDVAAGFDLSEPPMVVPSPGTIDDSISTATDEVVDLSSTAYNPSDAINTNPAELPDSFGRDFGLGRSNDPGDFGTGPSNSLGW